MTTSFTTVEALERRQKKTLTILFSIVFVGLGYVLYDYYRIINTHSLPESIAGLDGIVATWKNDGFVTSFDDHKAILIVNPEGWQKRKRSEKIDILTQLARHCAEKKKSNAWVMTILAEGNGSVLAEMGNTGFKIN